MADKKGKYWIDSNGEAVPEKYVPNKEKKDDQLVEEIFCAIKKLSSEIQQAREFVDMKIEEYISWLEIEYGVKPDWKGNLKISNFSDSRRIKKKIQDRLEFDNRLQLAKTKINECLGKWAKHARLEVKTIISRAFATDKEGKVNARQVLGLLTLNIDDSEWQEAMELIRQSRKINNTKEYYYFEERGQKNAWENIVLSFSAVGGNNGKEETEQSSN